MSYELYEVWGVDDLGHEELIDTTRSLKEAREIAKLNITDFDNLVKCIIYQEDDLGDLSEIEVIYAG